MILFLIYDIRHAIDKEQTQNIRQNTNLIAAPGVIKFVPIDNEYVIVHVCFVLFIVCLYICVCECLFQNNNHRTKHKNNTNSGSA